MADKSRIEDILEATIDGTAYEEPAGSRIEYLLLELKDAIEAGGGGTTDYSELTNKPSINGETLEGNKTAATLGLASGDDVTTLADKLTNIDNGGMSHNGIFRGKNLTNVYTVDEMYEMIHSGNFDDLYLGDYFTKSIATDIYTHFTGAEFESGTVYYEASGDINNRTWTPTEDATPDNSKIYATKQTKTENVTLMFAAFDYYYNMGDTALTTHHAVLIPRGAGFAVPAKMNAINTTEGGYYNSDMHQLILPCYAKSLKTALNGHLLAHHSHLSNSVNATATSRAGGGIKGAVSGAMYVDTELQLMSEQQVYGTEILTSSPYDIGLDYGKLPVFNYINPIFYEKNDFWLRTVGSTKWFAACFENGFSGGRDAYDAHYARPLIIFG